MMTKINKIIIIVISTLVVFIVATWAVLFFKYKFRLWSTAEKAIRSCQVKTVSQHKNRWVTLTLQSDQLIRAWESKPNAAFDAAAAVYNKCGPVMETNIK